MNKRKVLLIGWDAADWKIIHPLLDNDKMPNLQRLIKNGVMGNLASMRPELSPMLWTSIATGKRPYKHGILGFIEPGLHGRGIRPVTNRSRKTKTIWNILNQNGYRSLVVGWWPSHPAEPINGVMVSNHYQRAVSPYGCPWPVQKGIIHPKRLEKNLADLRVHPQDLDPGLMQLFVPHLDEIDQKKNHRIESIAKIIAETSTINRAATALLRHEKWDFAAVYFDGIDHFCHGFMDFHPPRLARVSQDDFCLYSNVVESAYLLHDVHLGTMLAEIDDETIVILVSDHGFHSDHLRPARIPDEPAGPAVQHRSYGVVVVSGSGVKNDELLYGSSLLDICPTLLSLYDLPVGQDMDGRVLVNAFCHRPDVAYIPSWDDISGEDGSHPKTFLIDPLESDEMINQLVDLGYIDRPGDDQENAAEYARRELRYNLAKSYMDGGLHGEGLLILEDLYAQWPREFRFGIELSHCYQAIGRAEEALQVLEEVFARKKEKVGKAEQELQKLRDELEHFDGDEKDRKDLQGEIRKTNQDTFQNPQGMHYLLGEVYHSLGRLTDALEHFLRAEVGELSFPPLFVKKGNVYEGLKQSLNAKKSYEKALVIDSENCESLLGLCRLKLADRKNKEAAHLALDCIALRYHTPLAHFYLGCALHRMGRLHDAIQALKVALEQNPNFPDAYLRLAFIYKNRLHMEAEADRYRMLAKAAGKRILQMEQGAGLVVDGGSGAEDRPQGQAPTWKSMILGDGDIAESVVIVSGLPRSGTSMVMQMLQAGGLALVTDGARMANIDNPKGYFEDARVKRLAKENEWILDSRGQAVKVVAPLLSFLPECASVSYRVIFIERDLDEILQSQDKMLTTLGMGKARRPHGLLRNGFFRQVEKSKAMLSARNIPVLYLSFHDCICNPLAAIVRINDFLGGILDEKSMENVVDSGLWRNRIR